MDIVAPNNSAGLSKQEVKKLKQKEYKKQYYQKNKERLAEDRKKYYEDNKDAISQYHKEYRERNKEKIKKYRADRREDAKEKWKKYYEANKAELSRKRRESAKLRRERETKEQKEQRIAYQKKYRESNPELKKERDKSYYEKNKDRVRQRVREYAKSNKEKVSLKGKIYRHSNRDVFRGVNKRRGMRLSRQNDGTITPQVIKDIFANAKSCPYCDGKLLDNSDSLNSTKSLDHLIPLSKGGLHSLHNVVVCCQLCNSRKHNLHYHEWLERLEEPCRTKAEKLYIKQHGSSPLQGVLPLNFSSRGDT